MLATVAAACLGGYVGLAGSASADGPVFNGTFLYTSDDGSTNTWIVTPCGSACAHVLSDTGNVDVDAQLVDGQWRLSYVHPAGWDCEDGTDAPATRSIAIDATTLQGTVSQGPDSVCGEENVIGEPFGFTLNQIG